MIVYNSTKSGFVSDVMTGRIESIVEEKFVKRLNRRVSASEKRSWANSMKDMCLVLQDDYSIHNDCGVAIEFTLPPTSKRIDFLIMKAIPMPRSPNTVQAICTISMQLRKMPPSSQGNGTGSKLLFKTDTLRRFSMV